MFSCEASFFNQLVLNNWHSSLFLSVTWAFSKRTEARLKPINHDEVYGEKNKILKWNIYVRVDEVQLPRYSEGKKVWNQ